MPQSPLAADVALTPGGAFAPLKLDANGQLRTCNGSTNTVLNITAGTVVKATPGRAVMVIVTTAGAAGALYDHATTSGVGAANLVAVIPATVGAYLFDWPCAAGITVVPGAAQVLGVSYV
jgi:hypothetical protein